MSLLSFIFSLLCPMVRHGPMVRVVVWWSDGHGRWRQWFDVQQLWFDGHGLWVRRSNDRGGGSAWVMGHRSTEFACVWWVLVHWFAGGGDGGFLFVYSFVVVCGCGFGSAWVVGHQFIGFVCVMGFGSAWWAWWVLVQCDGSTMGLLVGSDQGWDW